MLRDSAPFPNDMQDLHQQQANFEASIQAANEREEEARKACKELERKTEHLQQLLTVRC